MRNGAMAQVQMNRRIGMKKWISVKNKEPNLFDNILFVAKDYRTGLMVTRYGYRSKNAYISYDGYGERAYTKIEWWMPVPENPEEKFCRVLEKIYKMLSGETP